MVLTLYGFPASPVTLLVAAVLHEKNLPFKFVKIDVPAGENKLPVHLAKNPFGQVPYLEDDGYVLYEGRAIARYIAEKYADQGPALIPTDLKAKGIFEQAASVEKANFHEYASKIAGEAYYGPALFGLAVDQALVASLIKSLDASLDVYEQILATQKFLAGDEFTLADLFHTPWIAVLPASGCKSLEERPNVARWAKSLLERPSWQAVKNGVEGTANTRKSSFRFLNVLKLGKRQKMASESRTSKSLFSFSSKPKRVAVV